MRDSDGMQKMDTAHGVRAKRGDLVAIYEETTIYYQDRENERSIRVQLGRVTSVTRDGKVRRADVPWAGDRTSTWIAPRRGYARPRPYLMSSATVDVDATMTVYAARRYPRAPDSDMVRPCDSLDEARGLLVLH